MSSIIYLHWMYSRCFI